MQKIKYSTLLKDLVIIIFCILLGGFSLNFSNSFFLSLVTSIWLGFWIHALSLFVHEGAHGNLCENKKINDVLSSFLSVFLLAMNIKEYRVKHWEHHKHLGSTNDAENSYFNSLSFKNLLKFLTGYWALIVLLNLNNKKKSINYYTKIIFLLVHGLILSNIIFIENYKLFIFYTLSFFIFFPFFGTIRQILEHRNYTANNSTNYFTVDHGENNKIFKDNFFSRYFGAAGFNRHLLHHINPNISYTKFDDFEKSLALNPKYKNIIQENKTTYSKAFKDLFVF
jgi:fatty acid desaturase